MCRADVGRTVDFRVTVNGKLVMQAKGDGVIIATPTGSTAYAHAAGGPVLDPNIKAILLVPVCPTGSRLAPIVVPPSSEIEVKVTSLRRAALVNIDGKQEACLPAGEKLTVRRSEIPVRFFAWAEFYSKLKERL
jgi:NAD+ kinase